MNRTLRIAVPDIAQVVVREENGQMLVFARPDEGPRFPPIENGDWLPLTPADVEVAYNDHVLGVALVDQPSSVTCAWCGGSGVLSTDEDCQECGGTGSVEVRP